jgi:biopolymer transport protein ExbB
MIPLAACSILALAVIIDRAWTWWRLGRSRDHEIILARAAKGEWTEAWKLGEESRSPVARVLAAGILHRNPAPTLAMEAAARHESRDSSASCPCSTRSSRSRRSSGCWAP